ncbi:hypothetical protein SAMN04489712_107201 [Thermomonospora echinospora]|uniref:Homeodomain-like domain-containing protein n=1 Tax=Thermomonospora echinospora TaxID=1992 RepID=A0A1H6BKR1_9ACTN|nr:hypothetical protein [Thermomonospora echinospora]SEG61298.1 hypothetical protein SAMN04489712_107201 [Thermomonospora echinospora]
MTRTGFYEDEDPLAELRALARARRELERSLAVGVRRARNRGISWRLIAMTFGTRPRTLRRRYGGRKH